MMIYAIFRGSDEARPHKDTALNVQSCPMLVFAWYGQS